jgi:hypothetical protein
MIKKYPSLLLLLAGICLFALSCSKDDEPANPYDSIDHSSHTPTPTEPDPNSIVGLHKNIFFPRCANPGCHDGTFEPDFRTVESSYFTLLYQPVNKFTLDSAKIYTTRVIPHNVDDSWLVERLITSTTEYMPSNSIRLTTAEIDHVKNWINNGCPDANGNVAIKPNLMPNIGNIVALDSVFQQADTNRGSYWANPFIIPEGTTLLMVFTATDSSDGADATDPADFTVKEFRFSTDKNDFTNAVVIPATLYVPAYTAWVATVSTSQWPAGSTIYFRAYCNDGHHTANTEFPRFETMDYYKTYFSFHVQ